MIDNSLSEKQATVISHFGNEVLLCTEDNKRFRAKVKNKLSALVCGDRVIWQGSEFDEAIVVELLQRHGVLTRRTPYADEKLVAANIDACIIMVSHKPKLKLGLIDRYLAACELANLQACIVFNKIDLLDTTHLEKIKQELAPYATIPYPIIYISAKKSQGIEELTAYLSGKTAILVGQSGVGKSSVIRDLFPGAMPKIDVVSEKTNKGKHTTTHSELYYIDAHSFIIDSPGIREFGLNLDAPEKLPEAFKEFSAVLGSCHYRNCTHTNEPNCAVAAAVENGVISEQRWKSYQNILQSLQE